MIRSCIKHTYSISPEWILLSVSSGMKYFITESTVTLPSERGPRSEEQKKITLFTSTKFIKLQPSCFTSKNSFESKHISLPGLAIKGKMPKIYQIIAMLLIPSFVQTDFISFDIRPNYENE